MAEQPASRTNMHERSARMARRYNHPISVRLATATPRTHSQSLSLSSSEIQSFQWRERHYRVAEVIATWRLRDCWWDPAHATNRTYYRVRCTGVDGEQLFDLYHDAVT